MKELKEVLAANGAYNIVTYINSGNIIFDCWENDVLFLQEFCKGLILKNFKLDLPVMVIAADDVRAALLNAPSWWDEDNDKKAKHNAIFVIPPATVEDVFKEVGEIKPEYEQVGYYGRVIFWSAPIETFSRTRWSKVVGSKAYNDITIRNANTVKKLVKLCEG